MNLGGGLSVSTPHAGGYVPGPDSVPWPRPGRWLGEGVRLRSRASLIIQDTVRRCCQTGGGALQEPRAGALTLGFQPPEL